MTAKQSLDSVILHNTPLSKSRPPTMGRALSREPHSFQCKYHGLYTVNSKYWFIGGTVVSAVASQLRVLGSIPARDAVGAGGVSAPSASSVPIPEAGLAKGPFCVEFACSPRVP